MISDAKHLVNSETLIIVLLFTAIGCTHYSNLSIQTKDDRNDQVKDPQILFVELIFKKNDDDTQVELSQSYLRNGYLKPFRKNITTENGNYKCYLWDSNYEIIDSLTFENPLKRQAEWSEPGGRLNTKEIELKRAEYFMRIPWNSIIKFLSIHQYQEEQKLKRINTFKIEL